MAWSRSQMRIVEDAQFHPAARGYHPDDVERLRTRALLAMRKGLPLPDLDAMALRRTQRGGVSALQVDGLKTLLSVWAATTPVEDPEAALQRERDEKVAALAADTDARPAWSHQQMDHVREKTFTLVGRHQTAYEEHDVDDFLDSVVIAMRRGLELPDPQHARFASAGLRRGYDPKEVDDFLEEISTMRPEG